MLICVLSLEMSATRLDTGRPPLPLEQEGKGHTMDAITLRSIAGGAPLGFLQFAAQRHFVQAVPVRAHAHFSQVLPLAGLHMQQRDISEAKEGEGNEASPSAGRG